MVPKWERYAWAVCFAALIAFAVPWFLWNDSRVAYGLPVWLWWHVSWMAVAAVAFYTFTQRAWGIGIEEVSDA